MHISSAGSAVITGASRGLGAAIALKLAEEGRPLGLFARGEQGLGEIGEQCRALGSPKVAIVAGDAADPAATVAAATTFASQLEPCEILVNNAGTDVPGTYAEISREDFDLVMSVNVGAALSFCQAIVPGMVQRGAGLIVNVSSVAALSAWAEGAAYNSSKWAMTGFTHTLYDAVRAHRVRAMVIHPGALLTDWGNEWGIALAESAKPASLNPESVAEFIAFLAAHPEMMIQAPVVFQTGWSWPKLGDMEFIPAPTFTER